MPRICIYCMGAGCMFCGMKTLDRGGNPVNKLNWNLQRFAEEDPDVVIIDNPGDGNEPQVIEPAPIATPEPEPLPSPAPTPSPMPSGVSGEAWRNVEELLVTLSNNLRVNMADLKAILQGEANKHEQSAKELQQALSQLNMTMGEFKQLLESATVDGKPVKEDKEPEPQGRKRNGFMSRKRGR